MIVTALPHADLLEHDGEALLLADGRLARLSGIGATVVRLAIGGIDTVQLAAALEGRFGPPIEGSTLEALGPILDALAAQGLVELESDATDQRTDERA